MEAHFPIIHQGDLMKTHLLFTSPFLCLFALFVAYVQGEPLNCESSTTVIELIADDAECPERPPPPPTGNGIQADGIAVYDYSGKHSTVSIQKNLYRELLGFISRSGLGKVFLWGDDRTYVNMDITQGPTVAANETIEEKG